MHKAIVLALTAAFPGLAAMQLGDDRQEAGIGRVIVYVHNVDVPYIVQDMAQMLADRIFKKIGIKIDWRLGKHSASTSERPILIDLVTAPRTESSEAVGYALPYEGVHVRIFYERIGREPNRATVLAHVFVHEITHMLQGVVRHSDTGIMKARWTLADIDEMSSGRDLPFTPLDVLLIQKGLEARAEMKNKPPGSASAEESAEDAVDSHE